MDPIVAAALIAGAASVVVALIGIFGVILPKLLHINDQVRNSHGTNLRDDLDFIRDNILEIRHDVAWLARDHIDLAEHVALLEKTNG